MTLKRAGKKRGVVLLTRSKEVAEADDECPSVSLDLSCDSSSFDSDDCATRAEKVSDLVLPHIFGVSPCNCGIRHVTVPIATRILIANVRHIGVSNHSHSIYSQPTSHN